MIMVPVLLCIIIPAVILILFLRLDVSMLSGTELFEKIIPLMVSTIIASNAIVGEKERKTLETLLYTPLTNREFLIAKLLSSFLPALLISFLCFILFFAVLNIISYILLNALILRALIWLPVVLLLSPAVSLIGLSLTLLVSLKAKTFMEAQQLSGVVVLPFVILIVIQITGLLVFNLLFIVLFGIALLILGYVLIARLGPRFKRESIITRL